MTSNYTDEDNTVILQVVLSGNDERYARRFGKFYSPELGEISYPVSCDSHAYDVFRDEFENTPVYMASIVVMPYGPESYEPFSEDSSGTELAQYTDDLGWVNAE